MSHEIIKIRKRHLTVRLSTWFPLLLARTSACWSLAKSFSYPCNNSSFLLILSYNLTGKVYSKILLISPLLLHHKIHKDDIMYAPDDSTLINCWNNYYAILTVKTLILLANISHACSRCIMSRCLSSLGICAIERNPSISCRSSDELIPRNRVRYCVATEVND